MGGDFAIEFLIIWEYLLDGRKNAELGIHPSRLAAFVSP
jgi:hypothetical protein